LIVLFSFSCSRQAWKRFLVIGYFVLQPNESIRDLIYSFNPSLASKLMAKFDLELNESKEGLKTYPSFANMMVSDQIQPF